MTRSENGLTKNATRGFASMTPEKRREIATKGGKSVPTEKRAFSTNRALAVAAGKKGGAASPLVEPTSDQDKSIPTQSNWIGVKAEPAKKR